MKSNLQSDKVQQKDKQQETKKTSRSNKCPFSGCNGRLVDKGNGTLQCNGKRRHIFQGPI